MSAQPPPHAASVFYHQHPNHPIPPASCRSVPDCAILAMCLAELAQRYPNTKFVKIISTDCIPNYPDENLPTVLLYKDTKCVQHMVGLRQFGGQSTSPEQVGALGAQGGHFLRELGRHLPHYKEKQTGLSLGPASKPAGSSVLSFPS